MFELDLAEDVVKRCLRRGADKADAIVIREREKTVNVFDQTVRLNIASEATKFTIRLFTGNRGAVINCQGSALQALEPMIDVALDNASRVVQDKFVGPADPGYLAWSSGKQSLDVFDSKVEKLSLEELGSVARDVQSRVVAKDHRARLVDSTATAQARNLAFSSSFNFSDSYATTTLMLSVSAIKNQGDGGASQSKGQLDRSRQAGVGQAATCLLSGLHGEKAAAEAVATFDDEADKPCPVGTYPVVFSPEAARYFLFSLVLSISPSMQAKIGPEAIKIGARVSSSLITLIDDPLLPGGLGTAPFDHEGIKARRKTLIEQGALKENLLNAYRGRMLDRPPTGNSISVPDVRYAVTPSNAFIMNGSASPESLIADVAQGLYVRRFMSPIDQMGTEFNQQASGVWIENGKLTFPVRNAAVSASIPQLFHNVRAVANDLQMLTAIASPTLLVDALNIRPLA